MRKTGSSLCRLAMPLLTMLLSTIAISPLDAQDSSPDDSLHVELALDDIILVGDFYTDHVTQAAPAVLLSHMVGGNRSSWDPLIPALINAGYHVLAFDLRGHGESGNRPAWDKTEADTQAWIDWVKAQPHVDGVMMVGASVGANLSLIGCAAELECLTAIALSPGLDYRNIMPQQALVEGLADRSALLVAAYGDKWSYDALMGMIPDAAGELGVRFFTGNSHGVHMFNGPYREQLITIIIQWLDEHTVMEP